MRTSLIASLVLVFLSQPLHADPGLCQRLLEASKTQSAAQWLKAKAIDKALDAIAIMKGLPKYLKNSEELKRSGRYLNYDNFGEMGLAEIGISVRYNEQQLQRLNSGKPLIIVANHHLGIADGLSLQYLASKMRTERPTLLFLARWIEKLLPEAIYGGEGSWGTAVPVEINKPKESDPLYHTKMAELKDFNSKWSRTYTRVLRAGGALIIFPAGHVASLNESTGPYPQGVQDDADSWQDSVLSLARLGQAEIVFAHIDTVNSEAFYRNRKRFGGGDKERVIWFFSEAIAKKNQNIDVYLSKPMNLSEIYVTLSDKFKIPVETLVNDPHLTTELMRKFTYDVKEEFPQELDTKDTPAKKTVQSE